MKLISIQRFPDGRWTGTKFQATLHDNFYGTDYIYAGTWEKLREKLSWFSIDLPTNEPVQKRIVGVGQGDKPIVHIYP